MTASTLKISIIIDIILLFVIGIMLTLVIFAYRGYQNCNKTESSVCPILTCPSNSSTVKCDNYAYRDIDNKRYCSGQY